MRKHTSKEIAAVLQEIEVLLQQGLAAAEAAQAAGITAVTYYRWRKQFNGLNDDQVGCAERLRSVRWSSPFCRKSLRRACRPPFFAVRSWTTFKPRSVSPRDAHVGFSGSTAPPNARNRSHERAITTLMA